MQKFKFLWLIPVILFTLNVFGEIKLPAIIGNDMVLQQQSNVPLWGESESKTTVKVTCSWNHKTYTTHSNATGHWRLRISTPLAGGPYKITFDDGSPLTLEGILVGEVWVCSGQSNMEISLEGYRNTPILNANDILMKANNPNLRLFHVQRAVSNSPLANCKGAWEISTSESASTFSAVGFQFAQMLQHILKVPVGIIEASWGGTPIQAWMGKQSLRPFPDVKTPVANDTSKANRLGPTCLFNGMIAPIVGFGIKGFIWYQGEANVPYPSDYDKLMKSMVHEWRKLWGRDTLPFYFVQIAPYKYKFSLTAMQRRSYYYAHIIPDKYLTFRDSVALLREAQLKAQEEIPHSGMVVSMDAGNKFTIHPPDKTIISKRLLYWALGDTYQRKDIAFASPVYKNMKIKGNAITVTFTHTRHGFTSWDKKISGFEIAGLDKVFYPANASIYRSFIQVESDKVPNPVAVPYVFKDWVVGDLYNTEGLPVAPFRTDNW